MPPHPKKISGFVTACNYLIHACIIWDHSTYYLHIISDTNILTNLHGTLCILLRPSLCTWEYITLQKRNSYPYIQGNKSNMPSMHDILLIPHSFTCNEVLIVLNTSKFIIQSESNLSVKVSPQKTPYDLFYNLWDNQACYVHTKDAMRVQ